MLSLRPYKACDADSIVTWIGDEVSFRKWCADRYDTYPITAEDINAHYDAHRYEDNFFQMTACEGTQPVGHLIMRYTDEARQQLRFGFIIVDSSKRGSGYGCEMLKLALEYAFAILRVQRVTLGVFDNNLGAYNCYVKAGFREYGEKGFTCNFFGEEWKVIEMEAVRPS